MDFTPNEDQLALVELAARILDEKADDKADDKADSKADGTGSELWKALGTSGVLEGATETGLLGTCLLLEEAGKRTAGIPLAATCLYGIGPVSRHGTTGLRAQLLPALLAGTAVATGAFPQRGRVRSHGGDRLTGTLPLVPWLRDASHVLIPDTDQQLWLLRVEDATLIEPVETTAPWDAGRLTLAAAPAVALGPGGYDDTLARARTGFAALQAGVCAGSLALAVAYTGDREQFGRPLSTNQGVQLRAADAYMDIESIRVTAHEAAWRHDQGLPADTHSLTAAWWAAEAGRRVVHTGQHLHGGVGADVTSEVHRHFLWGRQLDAYLGSPAELLAELGSLLAQPEKEGRAAG
ncbi:acyl-CoA dehydrogenase family protein [Streptomyces gobiensis]|uniref:acyl-CoA dehydrogenase family protein n=1 Tax=Streptomyces gobiensis TaxID=2875706 RepID=UPI001E543958|nr:acyl-CoA dehydrogenase family protein [Streptomyces gobiensis]UGY92464.1 acyl-CoA/acyl-ACP dehydrogenase [Streptomyces gobiensis]